MTQRAHAHDPLGLAAALVTPLTWGLTGTFVRQLAGLTPPMIIVGRLLIAATVLGFVLVIRGSFLINTRLLKPAAVMAGYYVLATEAFAHATVVEVTLLIGTAPILALGIERLGGQRVARQQFLGILVAMTGLAGFLGATAGGMGLKLSGDCFALAAGIASAGYAVHLRRMAAADRIIDPVAVAAAACLFGAAGAAIVALLDSQTPPALTLDDYRTLALLGIVSTALPTVTYSIASARLPPVLTTSLGLLAPLFAALAAGMIIGEWPALSTLPGALLALAGLVLVVRSKPTSLMRESGAPTEGA